MELNCDSIAKTVFPTAAFAASYQTRLSDFNDSKDRQIPWESSTMNPKNRIDSLDHMQDPKWRVDGSAGMGTQFYILPVFLKQLTPIRIDTFIPEPQSIPVALRDILDISAAFYLRDSRVADLGISRYMVRILQCWSNQHKDFASFYNKLPFGSRIIIENITANIQDVKIQVVKTHFLERQLLSFESLQAMWNSSISSWPEIVDISELHLLQQLHDSVSLVRLRGQKFIFKALTSYPKYLYHELKVLLSLPPHPNIISRPLHLIVKHCKFGGKIAVIGFTLEYHAKGALRDILPFRRLHNLLSLEDQFKWAIQITEALIHIKKAGRFYCDLRLDNMVLENESDGIVMIDFESRGVGFSVGAPEVNYLECIHSIATEMSDEQLPYEIRDKFKQLYKKVRSGRAIPRPGDKYRNPKHGYSVPWLCLDEMEIEAAEVYMLGRVLWCIFEGVSSPEKSVMIEYLRQDALEFPNWNRTPEKIRQLIYKCVRFDSKSHRNLPVARSRRNLVLSAREDAENPDEVQQVARSWWETELNLAVEFLERRMSGAPKIGDATFRRPGLEDVCQELRNLQGSDSC